MIIDNYKYGISVLPKNCIAYENGYRYGGYKENLNNKNDIYITEFFKTTNEIRTFVNTHPEYGKEEE